MELRNFCASIVGLKGFGVCSKLTPKLAARKTLFLIGMGRLFSKTIDTKRVLRRIGEGMSCPFRGWCEKRKLFINDIDGALH